MLNQNRRSSRHWPPYRMFLVILWCWHTKYFYAVNKVWDPNYLSRKNSCVTWSLLLTLLLIIFATFTRLLVDLREDLQCFKSIQALVTMMNCGCEMVDQRKVFSLIFRRDHCQRFHHCKSSAFRDQVLNLGRSWLQIMLIEVVQQW